MSKVIEYTSEHEEKLNAHKAYIIEHMDYTKCVKTMRALDWEYWHTTSPDEACIKNVLEGLLERSISGMITNGKKQSYTSTGGWHVYIFYYKKEDDFVVQAIFGATEWSSGDT